MLNRILDWLVGIQPMPAEVEAAEAEVNPELEAELAAFAKLFVREGFHYNG